MRRFCFLLALVLVSACEGYSLPTMPDAVPSVVPVVPVAPSVPPPLRAITVGEQVTGTFVGTDTVFELTASASGALVVRLTWDRRLGLFEMLIGNQPFRLPDDILNVPLPETSISGTVTVVEGTKYRVKSVDGAPWDYGAVTTPFVLTTSIQ